MALMLVGLRSWPNQFRRQVLKRKKKRIKKIGELREVLGVERWRVEVGVVGAGKWGWRKGEKISKIHKKQSYKRTR